MGIYIELHSTPGQKIDRQELKKRLIEAGAKPYPEDPAYDTSGHFMLPGVKGNLELEEYETQFYAGFWGSIRLSWASSKESWENLLKIAEKINGRIFDSKSDQYLSYETLDEIMECYEMGVAMLGKAGEKEGKTSDTDFSRKNEDSKEDEQSNEEKTYSPQEFVAKILKSTKDNKIDIASKLPGGRSVSEKTIKDDSDDQEEREKPDSSGKS